MMKIHNSIITKNHLTNSIKVEVEKITSTIITETTIILMEVTINDPSNKKMKMKLLILILMESQVRSIPTIKVTINLKKTSEISEMIEVDKIEVDKKKIEILRCLMDRKKYSKEENQISKTEHQQQVLK